MPDVARILIIDDEPDTRANLCDILEMFGYQAVAVGTSNAALGRDDLDQFAVILLDRRLPDLKAEELLPALRERVPETDVVIVTGHADLESTIEALRLGASDYLLKPVNPDLLHVAIKRSLERRRLENDKRRSEAAFRQLVESAGSAIFIERLDHSVVYMNPYAERMTGLRAAEILGKSCIDVFIDEQSRPKVLAAFSTLNTTGELHNFEVMVRCRDGGHRWMLCNARLLDDYDGEPAIMSIGHDITARRDAEQGLYLLDAAIANLEEGVIITKVSDEWFSARIVYVNAALSRQMGYDVTEIIGRTPQLFEGNRTDRARLRQLDDAIATGRAITIESVCQRKDGTEFPVEMHLSPVADPHGHRTHTVATLRDISERRRAEERLLQAERLAAIGKAMTGLAHESRNALQRAQASLDLLAADFEDNPQATKLIKRIQVAQDDLHRLYEDVREYARPIRIEPHPCRLDDLLHHAWDELIVKRTNRNAQISEVKKTNDLTCDVEAFAIRQVFRNLLDNALAACADPVVITVVWSDSVINGMPALRVSLKDNGPGVSDEHRHQIFDEFFTTKTHGTGLGLAISRRFIDTHGGRIEAVDSLPPGLEIAITLPRHIAT